VPVPSDWTCAVRLDSGDLLEQAQEVRDQLDDLGATKTRIVVTSDLDEHAIAALAAAPVDGYGVGTSLVTGSGAPTAGLVYKLVARAGAPAAAPLVPVEKRAAGKPSRGGPKTAVRRLDARGTATAELVVAGREPGDVPDFDVDGAARPLMVPLVRGGEVVAREPLAAARDRHAASLHELPPHACQLSRGEPAIPTEYLLES
jgi:nicotinate phosphoribosyltransferase